MSTTPDRATIEEPFFQKAVLSEPLSPIPLSPKRLPYRIPRDGGDIATGLAIFALGLLTIREPFGRAYLKSIAALALLAVVFDLLGGLYALSAQLGLYLSLALLPKEANKGDYP